MRSRKLPAAFLLLVVAGVLALTGPASAQTDPVEATDAETTDAETPAAGEEEFADEEAEHCAEILAEGGEVDECQEAPSPILPETNELIWGAISFTVLFIALAKFGYPAIKKGMEARAERVRSDLEEAERAKADADTVLRDYRAQLADAKNESGRIIEEARQAADALRREQEQRLQAELAEMRQRAQADVESAKQQAIADLRSEVAQLAIGAAEVIVQRNLDRETQVQLVERYIDQVANRN